MNKIIFQIGLLAFCIAAVVFGTQGMGVLDMVARAFIVFVAVVCAAALILIVASSLAGKSREFGDGQDRGQQMRREPAGAQRAAQAAK